jgi:hypothetical protein
MPAPLIKKGRKSTASSARPAEARPAAARAAASAPEPDDDEATSTDVVAVNAIPATPTPTTAYRATNAPRVYGTTPTHDIGATYTPPSGAGDFQLPQRYFPAEPAPLPDPETGVPGGLIERALLYSGETTAAERDRQAAADWDQAMAPVMELMRQSIPDANTPEDATRILSENQGTITPDPNGGSFIYGDGFDRDARVYYRLLRRDYEKTPRPSEKRPKSHHLHEVYGKLTGNKGW